MTNLYEQPNLTPGGDDELAPPPSAPPPSTAPPLWDPDADKPKPAGPVKGHLSGGETEHRQPDHDAHRFNFELPNFSEMITSKWAMRVGIVVVFILFCILPYITIIAGLEIPSSGGAYAAVILMSLLIPPLLWACTIPCWANDDDEGTAWSIMTMSFAFVMLLTMTICITITVLSAPNSMRKYKTLQDGKFYKGFVTPDSDGLESSGARFFNFSDAMFFPGSVSEPIPMAGWRFSCGKYVTKRVCDTPLVSKDYIFGQPIRTFAGCSSLCGYSYSLDCYDLYAASRTASPIHNCMREWRNKLANTQWGATENITYAYKHVSYYGMHKRAAKYVGLPRDREVIYVRISRPEHVKDKQDRYYRYGFLSNLITFGIILGLSGIALVIAIIAFACSD